MGNDWKNTLAANFNVAVPKEETPQRNFSYKGSKKNSGKENSINKQKGTQVPTAPYNFVKLNDKVLLSPLGKMIAESEKQDIQSIYKDFMASAKKYSGYFEVSLRNLSPLFINDQDVFFNDGDKICIPGSSLRGCLKNTFKVITNGTMKIGTDGDITDKNLYYRSFASGYRKLRDLYKDNITQKIDGKDKAITKAGFLVRLKNEYYIHPANLKAVKGNSYNVSPQNAPCVEWEDNCVNVFTGRINNKKHYYRITSPNFNIKYTVSENLYLSYKDDGNRKGLDLINDKDARNGIKNSTLANKFFEYGYDYVVPCFYVEDKGEVLHFGAGPYYRLPYKKSIGEHVPTALKGNEIDFAAAVFGNKEYWGSRVYFENMFLTDNNPVFLPKNWMRPLLGANPTSFQNYLVANNKNEAMHWDENAEIRGYKMYWHRHCEWMQKDGEKINKNVSKEIAPLEKNRVFEGKVRFESLDAVELGALAKLFAFGEDESCCYKMGMGKPFGMGSVNIKAKLYLREDDYYTKLFAEDSFSSGIKEYDKEQFIDAFNQYVKENLSQESYRIYQERMQELTLIMSTKNMLGNGWNKKTEYISIADKEGMNLVNKRIPLPDINTVVGKKK